MNKTIAKPIVFTLIKYFLPLALVVLLLAWQVDRFRQKERQERLALAMLSKVIQQKEALQGTLGSHVSDAVLMARLVAQQIQQGENSASLDSLAQIMIHFSREKHLYHQVRYVGPQGLELVRINHQRDNPRRVPPEELQFKGHREYFRRGMALEEGKVHLSRLDLNQEHGRVEMPPRPMLRLASPVVTMQGKKLGLVVLNLEVKGLLAMVRQTSFSEGARLYLINRAGYWLVGPSPELEWGFDFPEKKQHTLAVSHPREWKRINQESSGHFITQRGLYTFASLGQLDQSGVEVQEGLILVGHLPWSGLGLPQPLLSWQETGVAMGLLGLLALGWAAAKVRKERAEREAAENQEKIMVIGESSQDAIAMVDGQDRVQFWNPAAERMFGWSKQEMMGARLHQRLVPPALRDQAQKGLARFQRTGQGASVGKLMELTALRKDGSQVPVEVAVASRKLDGQWMAVGSIRDITRRKQAEDKLRKLAITDELTGLSNRRRFLELCHMELGRSRRYGCPLSLIMMDLDHFKRVNDTWGHQTGDLVLRHLAELCLRHLREVDSMGRVGGEEFAVLLPDTGGVDAVRAAQRLRQAVEEAQIQSPSGQIIKITISLGVASLRSGEEDFTGLMQRADQALYRAKDKGRNRVEGEEDPPSG